MYLFVTISNAEYSPAFELHVSEDIKGTEEDESPEDDECDEARGVHMQTTEVKLHVMHEIALISMNVLNVQ